VYVFIGLLISPFLFTYTLLGDSIVGNRIFLRSMQTKNWRYALLDNGGRILQQNTWPQNSGLDVSTLLPGIYFLYLTEGKNTQRLRFIKLP